MNTASVPLLARRRAWVLVLVAAVLPFLNTLDNSFHYDDEHAIVRNHHLRDLGNIPSFFLDSSTFSAEPGKGMFRPLLQTSFALNYALGGYSPRGYHLVSLGLHALASLGVMFVLSRFLPPSSATAAAALFAMHPVQTQAINYLSSRSEILAAGLVLWALWFALRGRGGWSALLFALGVLSKSTALHFLPMLAARLWQGGRRMRWGPQILLPAAVAAGYIAIISLEGFLPRSFDQPVRPWVPQILTQLKVLSFYIYLVAVPVHLSVEHGVQVALTAGWTVVASGAVVLSLLWLVFPRLRHPVLGRASLGVVWFFAALGIPTLVPLTILVSEQRLYLPLAGACLALARICSLSPGSWRPRRVLVPLAILFAVLSWNRNKLWSNELSLWSDAVRKAPATARAQANLALALHDGGQREQAGAAYERALRLDPQDGRAWNNYGIWLEEEGRVGEAEAAYLQAAWQRFAGPRIQLGRLYLQAGQPDRARAQLDTALQLNPADPDAHLFMGRWYQQQGQDEAAREEYEEALRIDPRHAAAANNLGLLLIEAGDPDAGRPWLELALTADASLLEARLNLAFLDLRDEGLSATEAYERLWRLYPEAPGLVRAWAAEWGRQGRWTQALRLLEGSREARRGGIDITAALGEAYAMLARWPEAIAAYRDVLAQRPGDLAMRNRLAAALAAHGEIDAALEETRQVLAADPDNGVARRNFARLREARARRPQSP